MSQMTTRSDIANLLAGAFLTGISPQPIRLSMVRELNPAQV
jgi:hypothetical protein